MAGFAIGLPKLSKGQESAQAANVTLPDALPGGWKALELVAAPDGSDSAAYQEQQRKAVDFVNRTLNSVYDRPAAFQAYLSPTFDNLVTVTLFDSTGGAFAPANGVADATLFGLERAPVELTRVGDAVCIANYQSAAPAPGAAATPTDGKPLSVSCQAPAGEETAQIGSQGMSVDDTVTLLHDVAATV